MLEKAADNALNSDIFGKARNAGAETANAAHHQVDADPRLRRLVEQIDDRWVDECVHLGPDLGRPAVLYIGDLGFDELAKARPQVDRRDRHLFEASRASVTGHVVE